MYKPILSYRNKSAARRTADTLYEREAELHITKHDRGADGLVFVVEAEEPEVTRSLEIVEEKNLTEDAVHCPKCGSIHTEYPAAPQASPSMHVLSTMADKIFGGTPHFLCQRCSNTWT